MLRYLIHRTDAELEKTVGFHRGRLAPGYKIMMLLPEDALAPHDFELGASTRWSGGWLEGGKKISEMLVDRGKNPTELRERVARFFASDRINTPAKILPNWVHEDWMHYPDAEGIGPNLGSGIPQFKLLKSRRFVEVRSLRS